ncbi:histidinol-phosphate transaminase [Campylobacter vulpis]|uniref:Histidinol-phosphate aminotransferase n=1 Tax=Campylobacter vulpis TaxID=1655500 RepID=A0A2G4R2P2_9BACT|nr:histidinol-phosphate transaminase [Campylobacter vulpis]MBS4240285.1 histidinol-phosphate transaminase [Campylobacter vulpis]MBS4252508.1 histidinol-phosphate transaminase [Campylobacter vulpis]MBS4281276.1 histidinol-phosphate transaminase [Campylobacter vulpis]MBS4313610.1 histidinol-phosphate transaminase [Campylobacter vulpis]MBS4330033.1 histidinol-phosphate transaminase [Campylobacter vulpis]
MQFNENLNRLKTYEPGKDIELIAKEYGVKEVIKLASNENPLGTSQKAREAIIQNASKAYLYPDDSASELRNALALKFGLKMQNVIIGAGSDQIIELATHAKLNHQNAFLQCGVSFAMYEIYAKQVGAKAYKTRSITHDLNEFKSLYEMYKDEIKILYLCLPNNPLGECLNAFDVEEFLKDLDEDCLVVIDAAYNEFASFKDEKKHINPAKFIEKFPNLLYLGTFSKLYGLGGLRVGYGVANEDLIDALYKLRAPFNVNILALKAAVAALDDEEFVKSSLENNFSQMQKFEDFARFNAIEFIPSYTNFITYFFEEQNSSNLSEKLLKKGIIVRDLKSYGLNAMRITIGKPYENTRFFEEFEDILKKN